MVDEAKQRATTQSESPEQGTVVPPMVADDHTNASPAVETPVEGRQGFLGAPVLMVLVGGLLLAIVAWFVVEMIA